jgi:hypothetical protein
VITSSLMKTRILLLWPARGRPRTPNNTYIGQLKISKFTKINKQIFFKTAKQTLI